MTNAADQKLAPGHRLTLEQQKLVNHIEHFAIQYLHSSKPAIFTIYGDAGTGKSVVLSQLFFDFQQLAAKKKSPLYKTHNFFLVNHPEILKVYKKIAGNEKHVLKKNFNRPTSFINRMHKRHSHADITIIDEAHLLLSEGDHFNNFYQKNQLREIINCSQIVILVFDRHQVLRTKSFWNLNRLHQIIKPYINDSYHLKHQFRMTASDDLIRWIDNFTDGHLTPLPNNARYHYDFRVFNDAEKMRKAIIKRNQAVGLSRIVSTSGYPSTLDGGKHYIHEIHGFKMPWDQYNHTQTPWAELPSTINEVGSMFTCQGFDLNYVGIILGPPIYLKPGTHQIKVDFSKYTDTESLKKRRDIRDPETFKQIKQQLVLNSVNVLMKRGVKGMYVFAHDPLLRKALTKDFKRIQP